MYAMVTAEAKVEPVTRHNQSVFAFSPLPEKRREKRKKKKKITQSGR
jgi:hypothetical protein